MMKGTQARRGALPGGAAPTFYRARENPVRVYILMGEEEDAGRERETVGRLYPGGEAGR